MRRSIDFVHPGPARCDGEFTGEGAMSKLKQSALRSTVVIAAMLGAVVSASAAGAIAIRPATIHSGHGPDGITLV